MLSFGIFPADIVTSTEAKLFETKVEIGYAKRHFEMETEECKPAIRYGEKTGYLLNGYLEPKLQNIQPALISGTWKGDEFLIENLKFMTPENADN